MRRHYRTLTAGGLALALALGAVAPALAAHSERRSVPTQVSMAARPIGAGAGARPGGGDAPGLHVLSSSATGVTLELSTPEYRLTDGQADGRLCQLLSVPGLAATDRPGWPELPVAGALVAVPPEGALRLTVIEARPVELPGRFRLCPVLSVRPEIGPSGQVVGWNAERTAAPEAQAWALAYPGPVAEIASTAWARDLRVAQVRAYPFHVNPASGRLIHFPRIVVRLEFPAASETPAEAARVADAGGLERLLQEVVVNPEAAARFRIGPAPAPPRLASAPASALASHKLLVQQDGMYRLGYADLQAAGVPCDTLDPRTLRLFHHDREVAITVRGEEDGRFDPQDALIFYGQRERSRYTATGVYWLAWGGLPGARMAVADGRPRGAARPAAFRTTVRVEANTIYQSSMANGPESDRWYWAYIAATGAGLTRTHPITLPQVAQGPYTATVRGLLKGIAASPYHRTQIVLNGRVIHDATWLGTSDFSFAVDVPQAYLVAGVNRLDVVVPRDPALSYDRFYTNWFAIDYYKAYRAAVTGATEFDGDAPGEWEFRVEGFASPDLELYDVTDAHAPVRILNAQAEPGADGVTLIVQQALSGERRYLALVPAQYLRPLAVVADRPSALHSSANGADYILITHSDFYTAVQPLAAHRAAQGLRVSVVDVQDIYDEFSAGVFDPQAIHDFLAYAYTGWAPPAPSYVLLVGDGHYDYLNNFGYGEVNYIPPYLADVDLWMGEVAADNRYVTVSGADNLPDMMLGRLPVKTVAGAAALVEKIIAYEQRPPADPWNLGLLFVADNPDYAGDFYGYSDAIADHYVPAPYTAQKVYYKRTHATISAAQAAIRDAINAGRLVVNYVGHGTTQYWAQEKLFGLTSIPALTNADRLPFIVAMACLDGYFTAPSPAGADYSGTAEAVVRAAGRGAIASWSATGMGTALAHDFLNKGLFEALFFNGTPQLGPATLHGKYHLFSEAGVYLDQLDSFTLFGDPALTLNVARAEVGVALEAAPQEGVRPGETVTYTLVYSNAGPAPASQVVISAALPGELLDVQVQIEGPPLTLRPETRFVWDAGTLAPGAAGRVTLSGRVAPGFLGTLAGRAEIATASPQASTANDAAEATPLWVAAADLEIALDGPRSAAGGGPITYTLCYSNAGNLVAPSVVITGALASALEGPGGDLAGADLPGGALQWQVGDLRPGASGTLVFTVTLSSGWTGVLTNTVALSSPAAELSEANNLARLATRVGVHVFLPLVLAQPLG